jgi:hypothetical protein
MKFKSEHRKVQFRGRPNIYASDTTHSRNEGSSNASEDTARLYRAKASDEFTPSEPSLHITPDGGSRGWTCDTRTSRLPEIA